jgi:endonuclease/exonuclease/phosphatase family metal-dependent hydrolase
MQAEPAPGEARRDGAFLAHAASGVLCLAISLGIFEGEITLMYFDKSIDVTPELLATCALSLLAPVVARLLGPVRGIRWLAIAVVAALLVATLVRVDRVELVSSGAGIVVGTWWLALLAARRRDTGTGHLGFPLCVAIAILLAYRVAAGTLPLDELPPLVTLAADVLLALALLAGAREVTRGPATWTTADGRTTLGMFAIPFLLTLVSDVGLNGAAIAGAAGLGIGMGQPGTTQIGLLAAGVGVACALAVALTTDAPAGPIAAVALVVGAALLWGHVGPASLVGGAAVAFGLTVAASRLGAPGTRDAVTPIRVPTALGLGWLLAIVAALEYYVSIGSDVPLAIALAIVGVAALIAPRPAVARLPAGQVRLAVAALAVVAVVLPTVSLAATPAPASAATTAPATPAATTAGSGSHLRVMAYNIHLGYSNDNVPSIPDIAGVIAQASPDVVSLEEVSRGSAIAGSHDVLGQLAARLGYTYAFGPMFDDVEGVAILARLPIQSVSIVHLAQAPTPADLHRVALIVSVGGITFVSTHLGGSDFVSEVQSIVSATAGTQPIVVAGDMNSTADTPQMALFRQAGFTDLGAAANEPTVPADAPTIRIDDFWAKGVTPVDMTVVDTTASDHRPIVADITVP